MCKRSPLPRAPRAETCAGLLRLPLALLAGTLACAAQADVAKWSGGGATDNWTNPFNWDGVRAPLSNVEDTEVEFNAVAARTQADVNAPFRVRSIAFNPDLIFGFQQSFTITASGDGSLTIGRGGIDNNTDKDQTFNVLITLAAEQTWETDDSTLTFRGARQGAFDLELYGAVTQSNGAGLVTAPAVFVFSGNGAFHTGDIDIRNASLLLGANDTISSASTVHIRDSRSKLQLVGADEEIGGLSGFRGTVIVGPRRLTVGANNRNSGFDGEIQGSGELVKKGTGKLALGGDNAGFTGAIRIDGGTLETEGGNGISDQSTVTVAAGAKLSITEDAETIGALAGGGEVELGADLATGFNHGSTTFSGGIGGTGKLIKGGNGTFLLTGNNSFAGETLVNAGELGAGAGNSLSDGHGVTVAAGATLRVFGDTERVGGLSGAGTVILDGQTLEVGANEGDSSFSGDIAKLGQLTKLGAGRFTLLGRNSFKGSLLVKRGVLETSAGDNLQDTNDVTVDSGGSLEVRADREDIGGLAGKGKVYIERALGVGFDDENATFDGSIDGSGDLVKGGRGRQTLTGRGDLAGAVSVQQGSLRVSGRGALATTRGEIGLGASGDRDAEVRLDGLASWKVLESLTVARRGVLSIGDAALLKVGGELALTERSTLRLDGGSLFADRITLSGGSNFQFVGGRLAVETFSGSLVNAGGVLAPGASPGLTEVEGDFTQLAGGTLEIELAASAHDQVQVSGRAMLGGTLQVRLIDGFDPAVGSVFDILLADGGISGAFAQVLLPQITNRRFELSVVDTQRLRLAVAPVPLPPAAVLFGSVLVLLGRALRRTSS